MGRVREAHEATFTGLASAVSGLLLQPPLQSGPRVPIWVHVTAPFTPEVFDFAVGPTDPRNEPISVLQSDLGAELLVASVRSHPILASLAGAYRLALIPSRSAKFRLVPAKPPQPSALVQQLLSNIGFCQRRPGCIGK